MVEDVGRVLEMFRDATGQALVSPKPPDDLTRHCTEKAGTVIIVNGDWVMCCEKKGQER